MVKIKAVFAFVLVVTFVSCSTSSTDSKTDNTKSRTDNTNADLRSYFDAKDEARFLKLQMHNMRSIQLASKTDANDLVIKQAIVDCLGEDYAKLVGSNDNLKAATYLSKMINTSYEENETIGLALRALNLTYDLGDPNQQSNIDGLIDTKTLRTLLKSNNFVVSNQAAIAIAVMKEHTYENFAALLAQFKKHKAQTENLFEREQLVWAIDQYF